MEGGQQELLTAGVVELLPDDLLDLVQHPQSQGQEGVHTRCQSADVAGPDQQLMAGHLGVGGRLAEGSDQQPGHAHGRRSYRPLEPPPGGPGDSGGFGTLAVLLPDELHLRLRGVGITALGLQQVTPVRLRLRFGTGVGGGQAGLHPFGHQLLRLIHQGLDHLVLRYHPDDLPLDEQMAPVATGGDASSAFDATQQALAKTGADKVNGFVCLESSSGNAVGEVLKRANATDRTVIAMDVNPETLNMIGDGTIDSTISQKPYTMGYYGLEMRGELFLHKPDVLDHKFGPDTQSPLPVFVDTGATLIDKGNVDHFISERDSAASAGQ